LDDTGNVMNFDANAHTAYDNLKFKMGDWGTERQWKGANLKPFRWVGCIANLLKGQIPLQDYSWPET
jgi:hypothetical protein